MTRMAEAASERPAEVYFASQRSKTAKVEHWDHDCPNLNEASSIATKPASVVPEGHYPVCKRCGHGGKEYAGASSGTPSETGLSRAEQVLTENGMGVERCPNGDRYCNGEDDLREGRLPCSECMHEASDDLWETMLSQRQ